MLDEQKKIGRKYGDLPSFSPPKYGKLKICKAQKRLPVWLPKFSLPQCILTLVSLFVMIVVGKFM